MIHLFPTIHQRTNNSHCRLVVMLSHVTGWFYYLWFSCKISKQMDSTKLRFEKCFEKDSRFIYISSFLLAFIHVLLKCSSYFKLLSMVMSNNFTALVNHILGSHIWAHIYSTIITEMRRLHLSEFFSCSSFQTMLLQY